MRDLLTAILTAIEEEGLEIDSLFNFDTFSNITSLDGSEIYKAGDEKVGELNLACPPDNSDNPNIGVPTLQKLLMEHLKGRKVRFTRGDEVLTGIERTEIKSLPKYMFVCVAKRKPKTNPLLCLSPAIAVPTDAKKAKAILVGHAHHRGTHKSGHYTM